ncbi:MAG TPA: UDP-N-acetylmuramate--L-alanine ligase [Thermoanaerobaculia bacterium]|nr:UDP-N-acetylmuramate--L-alanine ligase [Thermoanaerobaculia bacterium]
MNFGHIKNIHFVGIGGIGMSGIAEILSNYDLMISGCDLKSSAITDRLVRLGIPVAIGHDERHLADADLVVISSAVRQESPEVAHAREINLPVVRRAEMLGEIMRLKRGIAIAGTHGKTTTSAMTALVLSDAGLDPTLIIGGVLRNIDSSARLGTGEFLVVEADEYDRSFLTLEPSLAVITSIEADHLDCYRDLDDIRDAFAQFARRVPFYGSVIGCIDDDNVRALLDSLPRRSIRYGLGEEASLRAVDLQFDTPGTHFTVERSGESLGTVQLRVPGSHNVRNALAAIAVAFEIDVPFETAAASLEKFTGVERRFQILGEWRGAIVVDDYAHHPTEIAVTLEAARRSYPGRRLVALFQPHLYSRTRDFSREFADSLQRADLAFVSQIYPAREDPIEGISSSLITEAARKLGAENVKLMGGEIDELVEQLRSLLGSNDLFLTMGAGDINGVGQALVEGES